MAIISEIKRVHQFGAAQVEILLAGSNLRHAADVLDGKPLRKFEHVTAGEWLDEAQTYLTNNKSTVHEFSQLAYSNEVGPIARHHDAQVAVDRARRLLERNDTRPDFIQGSVDELREAADKLDAVSAQLRGAELLARDNSVTTRHLQWGATSLLAGIAGTTYVATR